VPPSALLSSFAHDFLQAAEDCNDASSDLPSQPDTQPMQHRLWVVEESFGEESLHSRLERGLLSWQQVRGI
jgi:hypothetical protein